MTDTNFLEKLKVWSLYPLPHHFLSRLIFWLTRRQTTLSQSVMRWFAERYGVDMTEAQNPDFSGYPSFNAFFTRELKEGARTICSEPNTLACPVDGAVSQAGNIRDGEIFQAKGHYYSLASLLGGDEVDAAAFRNGKFATLYLSPRDYHRIHMPADAVLEKMIHVPGRLFSVAPHTVRNVPNLFARNERVVALFNSQVGKFAMVLVGAINVAAIETVWAGLVTPKSKRSISRFNYGATAPIALQKGEEMGRFNMGSTVILITQDNVSFNDRIRPDSKVQMGEPIATFTSPE